MARAMNTRGGTKRALSLLALFVLGCGGSSASDGRNAEHAAGSDSGGAGGGNSESEAGGGGSGGAQLILAGAGFGAATSGGRPASGGQPGLGGAAGASGEECACWSEASCPSLDYLLSNACDALEPGQGLVRFWYEDCDLIELQFGSVESMALFAYDPSGALVGRLRGDLLEGMTISCGSFCSTQRIRSCALCGTTNSPLCEP